MLSTLHLTILLAGIVTFLLRWLPVMHHSAPRRNLPGSVRQLLAAIGPAALAALLTISLFPMLFDSPFAPQGWNIYVSLLVIILCKNFFSGIAIPTVLGTFFYGICTYFINGF